MAAFKLMDPSDLQSPKIPKGQRRLLRHIAKALSSDEAPSVEPSPAAAPEAPIVQPAATASTSGQNEQPVQAIYDQTLLNSLITQQQQLAQTTGSTPVDVTRNNSASPFNVLGTPPTWNDPQIHIASATGKSVDTYYDICDCVPSNIEKEVLVGENGEQSIIVKSGPKNTLLENLTLSQWSVANMAILCKLLGEGKLNEPPLLDYLSHTTKIYQLVQQYGLLSVLQYDRECRKLQSTTSFRWGTDRCSAHP